MFWEEKVERFKKFNPTKDFSVPYTVGSEILKRIEGAFNITYDEKYPLTNWKERITGLKEVSGIEINRIFQSNKNHWVIISNSRPTGRNLVYNCKASLIQSFTKMHNNDYYVVDKKYSWLVYYNYEEDLYYLKTKS